jgi:hypothetical protein
MKKIMYLAGFVLLSTALFFTACSTKDENPDLPPGISFVIGDTLVSNDATVPVGSTFSVKVLCEANTTSGAIIKTLRVTRVTNNQVFLDQTIDADNTPFTVIVTFEALAEAGMEVIEFTTTDKDGQTASINLEITTEEAAKPIDSWTERLLGSWNNPTGSSFASINGNVYTLDEAFVHQSLIDYMYWWGQTTSATIGCPADTNAAKVFNTGNYKLDNWTTKNDTKFKTTTITSAEFDAISDASVIIPAAAGADQTHIGALAVDQVIAFITVTNKSGLIRVKGIAEGSDGTMTVDVKVEK